MSTLRIQPPNFRSSASPSLILGLTARICSSYRYLLRCFRTSPTRYNEPVTSTCIAHHLMTSFALHSLQEFESRACGEGLPLGTVSTHRGLLLWATGLMHLHADVGPLPDTLPEPVEGRGNGWDHNGSLCTLCPKLGQTWQVVQHLLHSTCQSLAGQG